MSNTSLPYTGPYRPIPVTIVERANDTQRVEEMMGGTFRLCGTISVVGSGEALVAVKFPIRFLQKPSVVTGGEVGPSSLLQNGSYPTISGVVKDWLWDIRSETGSRFYSGASWAIVTTGPPEQQLFLHYQLEGRALRNPA